MSATAPKYTCDGCGRDISTTTKCVDYRLTLWADSIPSKDFLAAPLVHIEPPIREAQHFCGINCLRNWVRAIPTVTAVITDAMRSASGLVGGE